MNTLHALFFLSTLSVLAVGQSEKVLQFKSASPTANGEFIPPHENRAFSCFPEHTKLAVSSSGKITQKGNVIFSLPYEGKFHQVQCLKQNSMLYLIGERGGWDSGMGFALKVDITKKKLVWDRGLSSMLGVRYGLLQGNKLYLSGDGNVSCLNSQSGKVLWKHPVYGHDIKITLDGENLVATGFLQGYNSKTNKPYDQSKPAEKIVVETRSGRVLKRQRQ